MEYNTSLVTASGVVSLPKYADAPPGGAYMKAPRSCSNETATYVVERANRNVETVNRGLTKQIHSLERNAKMIVKKLTKKNVTRIVC